MKKKDTLVIIGNGFDLWQKLDTSYQSFQNYYIKNRNSILRKLRINEKLIEDYAGTSYKISDVELIYGDAFDPYDLDSEFWNTFEASLAYIDDERINLYFGKDNKGLKEMKKSIVNAQKILTQAFCDWISTIKVEKKECNYKLKKNCLYISFNYTDTLSKCFDIPNDDIIQIHGTAKNKKSIIFGHSSHPDEPDEMLYQLGGRFRGLYFIESILYVTDKQIEENIQYLCEELAWREIMNYEIKDIYILGHSLGEVDIEYFKFLWRATSTCRQNPQRKKDAAWHISYHNENDKKRALKLMKTLKCKNFKLYKSIDEAIEELKDN